MFLAVTRDGDAWTVTVRHVTELEFQRQRHPGVKLGDYLYGMTGREFVCLKWDTGEVLWKHEGFAATFTVAAGCLYLRSRRGTMLLVEAETDEYVEKGTISTSHVAGRTMLDASGCGRRSVVRAP